MVRRNALTWEELAVLYDKSHSGRKARTLPMGDIFLWAELQTKIFFVAEDGKIYLRRKGKE